MAEEAAMSMPRAASSDVTEPDEPPMGRIDVLLDRGYRRLGWRLLLAHAALSWLLGLAVGMGAIALISRVEQLSTSDRTELVALAGVAWGICLVLGMIGTRRMVRPLAHWFEQGREPSAAADAWRAVHTLPFSLSRLNALIATFVAIPLGITSIALVMHLSTALLIVVGLGGLVGSALGTWFGLAGLQLLLRPLIRDVERSLDSPLSPEGGTTVRFKLLAGVPAIALFAGLAGVLLAIEPGTEWGEVLTTCVEVSLAIAVLVIPAGLLLAHSTVQPLDDLLHATERLRRGDFATRVPELSGDEYGALARSFNAAMEGLAERQRFAAENERLLREVGRLLDEVRASRARIVVASDAERRRVERNIHDGAQQRLVALNLDLRMLEEQAAASGSDDLRAMAADAGASLVAALEELRELARGLHPSVLATDGLAPALEQLASRSPADVKLAVPERRYPPTIESTAYFIASEGLANVAKYAHASQVEIAIEPHDDAVLINVSDNGVGGAQPESGSGLAGLADRVAAIDGTFTIDSPPGHGTRLTAKLPLRGPQDHE